MELLLIVLPLILFFSLLMYVLVQGVYRLSYGLKTHQRKVVIEGIVVLVLFSISIIALIYFSYNIWNKHELGFS